MTAKEFNAYMAGFFDGEGYVGIYKTNYQKNYMAVRVIIGQSTPEVLDMGCEKWGGSRYSEIDKRTGKMFYRWEIRGTKASVLLKDMLPFIVVKREQAILALEFQKLLTYVRQTDEMKEVKMSIFDKIKSLNSPMGFGRNKEARIVS